MREKGWCLVSKPPRTRSTRQDRCVLCVQQRWGCMLLKISEFIEKMKWKDGCTLYTQSFRVCPPWRSQNERKRDKEGMKPLPIASVRGTPYASDSRLSSVSASDSGLSSASAPATSSLFRNAFGRMTSYATRSWPASAPDRMMSQDSSSRSDISSDPPSVYDTMTQHVCCTLHVFPNFGLISYIHYFVY